LKLVPLQGMKTNWQTVPQKLLGQEEAVYLL
jgi:hypothetical protein